MGSLFDFKCEKCSFTSRCSNGQDRGFEVLVQPLYCTKCKILKNIHIGDYVRDETAGFKIINVIPTCEGCSQSDTLITWDGKTCPNCGSSPLLMRDLLICWD